ncbi:MAG: ABC transporter ATP-binding protein [Lachnospiraceae bacterium]|nr:ABC transporter ATP-binding protein [Lachnospiraceae bacterium]
MKDTILEVNNLIVGFQMYQKKGFRKDTLQVIHSLSLDVRKGELLAVVGSSGSGKSILAHAILNLLPKNSIKTGLVLYKGAPIDKKRERALLGKEIAFIPQSVDYLDPLMKVGKQVRGVYGTKQRQEDLFCKYQLEPDVAEKYPFQLSGGMARRTLICGALMGEPELVIADEPTPGLSLDMAMETLKHFRRIADEGAGVLMITHDLDLALHVADRVAVFYAGTILEIAPKEDFVKGKDALRHPYSKALIDALPQNDFKPIPGTQPYAGNLPSGCLFADRCSFRTDQCVGEQQERIVRGGKVRCVNAI